MGTDAGKFRLSAKPNAMRVNWRTVESEFPFTLFADRVDFHLAMSLRSAKFK